MSAKYIHSNPVQINIYLSAIFYAQAMLHLVAAAVFHFLLICNCCCNCYLVAVELAHSLWWEKCIKLRTLVHSVVNGDLSEWETNKMCCAFCHSMALRCHLKVTKQLFLFAYNQRTRICGMHVTENTFAIHGIWTWLTKFNVRILNAVEWYAN